LFFSADDVDSLVGAYGVESLFANRFSMLSYSGSISEMEVFKRVGQYKFTHTLKTHIANYINEHVDNYIAKGIQAASVDADKIVSEFHNNHSIANKVGDFESNIDSLAQTVANIISAQDESEFNALHDGETVYMRPRMMIQDILYKIGGRSESVKLSQQWKKIVDLISDEGVKNYKIDGKSIKGFKLKNRLFEDENEF
jgi:hypothetical protein